VVKIDYEQQDDSEHSSIKSGFIEGESDDLASEEQSDPDSEDDGDSNDEDTLSEELD
jgi:hypothetical protein